MKVSKQEKKIYRFEIEFEEHELKMLYSTMGVNSLPELVHKSFPEYKVDELKLLFESMRAVLG